MGKEIKLSEKTSLSFHLVVVAIVVVIWIVRLSDRVESDSQAIASLQDTIKQLDEHVSALENVIAPRTGNNIDEN